MAADAEPALDIRGLTVAYHDEPVLWDIDLTVPRSTILGIVGPNGAGKTTLLKAVLDLVPIASGRVRVLGDAYAANQNRVGYVPQRGSVDWDFPTNALDVVLMGLYGELGWFRRPGAAEKEKARNALDQVGMLDYADRQISQLSGGQQQRVFLARALVQEADLYLMDEPLQGVDATTERTIIDLLRRLRNQGRTLLVVHHDLSTVREYFDQVLLLNVRAVASGSVETAFTDANVRETYAGGMPA
ncbi:MAG: metal ABC transporter ATP-binding protein [Longimonas sp.]|uniref:metal ABC transporter ATP-binding protein n=1 Tax=Longimonas sp. TaxID=2039626 RepID=UPI0033544178